MHFASPLLLLSVVILGQALTPSSFLSTIDKERLQTMFDSSLNPSSDTSSLAYSILGYSLLKLPLPSDPKLCLAMEGANDDQSVETLYLTTSAALVLGCPVKLGAAATAALKNGQGTSATAASLFFSVKTETNLGGKLNSAEIKKALTAALKKDDSLLSLGLAFHTAAMLEGDMTAFYDRIEDAIVQADEVDGKMLQFEGGLSVTSIVLTGAFALAEKTGKPVPMTGEQAVKFANYLMSRKSVQQPKGGFHLLEAVLAMANNKQHLPVSVSLAGSVAVSAGHPVITVLVSDLAGGSLGPMEVTLDSATRQADGAVILANEKLQQNTLVEGDQSMRYTLDLMKSGPPAGFYELLVTAVPAKADSRLVGNSKVVVPVKILTTIAIEDAELRITDTDQSTDGKARKLNFPAKLKEALAADNSQQIKIKFSVKDESAGAKMLVHQAFVRVANKETGAEIIYVAQANNNKVYSFELDIGAQAKEFKSAAGVYSVSVVLGDATASNSVAWAVADIDISFGGDDAAPAAASPYANKPEIKHTFRLPEKRPSELVSNLFTVICLSPILLVLGLWMKLGVNISNFDFSVAGLGFHAGLGGIFTLYMYFFLQLNMFTTVKYLVLIGLVTFLCGNSLLSKIARNNSKK